MVGKFIAAIAAALVFTCASASAEETVTGYTQDNMFVINQNEQTGSSVIISDYSESGKLAASGIYFADENGLFKIPIDRLTSSARAWFIGSDKVIPVSDIAETDAPSGTAEPAVTEAPQATAAPEATHTPKPTTAPHSSYPEIYGKEINAVNAFSVVEDVAAATVDGEEYFEATLLFQGSETKAMIPADLLIGASSEEFSYMDGKNAGALEEGDVIFTRKNLMGEYAVLSLIYRPLNEDIAVSGVDYGSSFEKLISSGGKVAGYDWSVMKYGSDGGRETSYAFGVVYERNAGEIALLGPDGDTNNALYISARNDTIVYEYDMSARRNALTVSKISGVRGISGAKPDENGIIDYTDASKYTYALVRAVDGTATDIIVFTNYR